MSCRLPPDLLGAVSVLLCASLTAALLPAMAVARPSNLAVRFETFSGVDGLSSSNVGQILQGHRGYLWLATDYGLNRYDGYEFKQYLHEPTDSTSISGAYIYDVSADRQGCLWIRLVLGGISRFDPTTETFRHFAHDSADDTSISAGMVAHMANDSQGGHWFVLEGGELDRYDPESDSFQHHVEGLRHFLGGDSGAPEDLLADDHGRVWLLTNRGDLLRFDPEQQKWAAVSWRREPRADEQVTTLSMGAHGTLWLATSGTRLLEVDTGTLQVVEHPLTVPGLEEGVTIKQILESRRDDDVLWLSFGYGGLGRYVLSSDELRHYPTSDEEGEREFGRRTILPPGVQTLHEDRTGTLWVALCSRGLLSLDANTNRFRWHRNRLVNSTSIGPYQVHQIFEDRTGILWFASRGAGVSKFNPRQLSFSHDLYEHRFRDIIDGASITAGLETARNIAWIGTASNGFFRYDRDIERITHRFFARESAGFQSVQCMVRSRAHPNILWVGSSGGLARVDVETFEIQQYTHDPDDAFSLKGTVVTGIVEDDEGQLWVGTQKCGLQVLDLATERFRQIPHSTSGPEGTSHGSIWAATRTRDGQLWFGVIPGGVHRYDPATQRFHHYVDESEMSSRSYFPKSVYAIVEGHDGLLWMATYSGGLVSLDRHSNTVVRYTRRAGLPSNRVYGILEGEGTDLWLSSDQGLARFDRATGVIENFDRSDGLQNDEFLPNAYWRSESGELFFGGIDGLTGFFPDEVERNPYAPPVQVTALRVLGKGGETRFYPGVSSGDTLQLDHDSNHIEVEFAALDFSNPTKNLYSYRLEGLDKQWCAASTRRFASWSHLDPGEYVLRIRGSNNHGVWNKDGFALAVIIEPPFYRTAWFMTVLAVLLGALVLTAHRLRVRAATLRIHELERVRQVEVERVRKEAARDIHDELGHLVTRISLFGEIARQRLPASMNGGSPAEYLQRITDTSKDLAEGLGDFVWTLDPKSDSVLDVLVRLKDFGDKLFSHTGIDFQVAGLEDDLARIHLSLHWRRHLTMLFKEGMTNALKHSRGTAVELRVVRQGDLLQLSLADDGHGFDMQIAARSRGQGLHNMDERARKLGGRVTIQSRQGRGTRLSFTGNIPGDEK